MNSPRFRTLSALGFLACVAGLALAYYVQFQGYDPCPMCIFQRLAMAAAGLVFLAGAVHGPKACGRGTYAVLASLFALMGAGIAGRQVWIQHLPPDQALACGPSLDHLLSIMPLQKVITTVLKGDGSCADVSAQWLGYSLATWSLAAFLLLAIYALLLMRRERV